MVAMLGKWGNCDAATNSAQGLGFFEASLRTGNLYDAVFVDMLLPDKLGADLMALFNALEEKHHGHRAGKIIITADTSPENIAQAKRANCDVILAKPLSLTVLTQKMVQLGLVKDWKAQAAPVKTEAAAEEVSPQADKFKVLKQQVRLRKKNLFKFCLRDTTMIYLLDAIAEEEARSTLDAGNESPA